MLALPWKICYNFCEIKFLDNKNREERGGRFMKKEYETPLVLLLWISEDAVRCSEGAQEDIFGNGDWN